MPNAAPASNSRRARSTRSVAGCLTCRRRRVKCTSRTTPCEACSRLALACVPSFHQNFKSWTMTSVKQDAGPVDEARQAPQGESVASTSSLANANEDAGKGPQELRNLESFSMVDFIFCDLATELTPVDFNAQVLPDALFNTDWATQRPSMSGPGDADGEARCDALMPTIMYSQSTGIMMHPPLDTSLAGHQAMCRVPEWLSTKESIWGCFHYLVTSAQAIPNSPLCHAILAWTYAYLSNSNASSESSRSAHYAAASAAVRMLSDELCGSSPSGPSAWRTVNGSDQLSLYVSSTFFLCHHDLMTGDFESFADRIHETKVIFQRHWAEGTTPGPVECRIVIWLAFLELRFFFLAGDKICGPGPQNDLMTILMEAKAVPVLRRVRTQKSLLSECFGNGLPQEEEEEEEELRKNRCRLKFDDLMYYLAKVRRFEIWDAEHEQRGDAGDVGDALLRELREAKVEVLRADLGRLQAECDLAFPSLKSRSSYPQPIDSAMFHTLTVDALRSCATIVFSRAINPKVRVDHAAQAAVARIVRIARLLRKAKHLKSPRSTIWPLPLFIAGIETTDEVYQDWIVDCMRELEPWGAHVRRSTEALEQTITWQERNGRRARMRDSVY